MQENRLDPRVHAVGPTASLAALVKARRRSLALSQADLAGLAGVSVRFLHELENRKPTVQTAGLVKILAALGLRLQVEAGPSEAIDSTIGARRLSGLTDD